MLWVWCCSSPIFRFAIWISQEIHLIRIANDVWHRKSKNFIWISYFHLPYALKFCQIHTMSLIMHRQTLIRKERYHMNEWILFAGGRSSRSWESCQSLDSRRPRSSNKGVANCWGKSCRYKKFLPILFFLHFSISRVTLVSTLEIKTYTSSSGSSSESNHLFPSWKRLLDWVWILKPINFSHLFLKNYYSSYYKCSLYYTAEICLKMHLFQMWCTSEAFNTQLFKKQQMDYQFSQVHSRILLKNLCTHNFFHTMALEIMHRLSIDITESMIGIVLSWIL